MRTSTLRIGEHRNNPRLWLQGKWLAQHGFVPGSGIDVQFSRGRIDITPGEQRKVSGKKDGTSVIDLNTGRIREAIRGAEQVTVTCERDRIVITPARTVANRSKRIAALGAMSVLSYFAGGGLLDAAAEAAGFEVKAAVELNENYAEIHAANHPRTHLLVQSVEQVDHERVARHGPFDLMIGGIPCEPYSLIRRTDSTGRGKAAKGHPEQHELGDMSFWFLHGVAIHNPHTVVIEQVPAYLDSASFCVLRHVLERRGYRVEARKVNPMDYGSITGRRRACVVATTFDAVRWPAPTEAAERRRLGDLLDEIPLHSDLWFGDDHWAPKHWAKQSAKGNGFAPPVLTADCTAVPTIKKRYFAGQGDNPVVAHPRKKHTYRWLTVSEVARIMGLPDGYELGQTKTHAGEVLGQGVEVGTFSRIIASVMGVGGRREEAA
jgi:DNA (cytosine-5)-methyltransferase 1